MRRSYVTKEYDFFNAITKDINLDSLKYQGFEIIKINHILDNAAIVRTTHGDYYCESFKDDAANIYMKVSRYL